VSLVPPSHCPREGEVQSSNVIECRLPITSVKSVPSTVYSILHSKVDIKSYGLLLSPSQLLDYDS